MTSALILGMSGLALTAEERAFFQEVQPWGFILFARNCADKAQVLKLTDSLRAITGRADTPILIDQEGGRVARLKAPVWRHPPPAAVFAELYERDVETAMEAAFLNSRLIATELTEIGVNVSCSPCLDLLHDDGHGIIGDRALGRETNQIAELGRAVAEGLLDGAVLPVIKHIPGHGRAKSDSHLELPVLDTEHDELSRTDFVPFRSLNDMPMAMTAHVVYQAIDPERCATLSSRLVHHVIRGEIGFDGLLMSDDVGMHALSGGFDERTHRSLVAGCDVALHCSGKLDEMQECAKGSRALEGEAARRAAAALDRITPPSDFDAVRGAERLTHLLSGGTAIA
ncbi:Beta-hexosaminidase [Alphaproteobacteria bacterium SO-S41]|nr:Beta-hexosaminidase [Alphaproteobacteria bacterium SO-S41]